MGAYYDGESWEYILPNAEAMQNGYLQFGTPHFSRFAVFKLEKEKALDKYAETLATQNVTGAQPSEGLTDCFTETLDKMGFTDETVQGIIMQKIAKELHSSVAFITNAKNGEATKAGAQMWQDYSVESAYNVYLKQKVAADGNVSADSWDIIFYNMGSGLDFMQREYRTAYANASGKTLKEIDADKELRDRLYNQVINEIKRKFITRYTNTNAIEAEKVRIKEMLNTFDAYGLLSWNSMLGFPVEMEYATRD